MTNLNQKLASLSPERRKRIEARAKELIAEEMTLRDLRKAMGHTQVRVAKALGVGQDTVSRYESRSDMLLSTLNQFVEQMGGKLVLTATFPDRGPVRIRGLGEIRSDATHAVLSRKKSERPAAANMMYAKRAERGGSRRKRA
jgi:transcriptional regulator with XRE-family HTH domain